MLDCDRHGKLLAGRPHRPLSISAETCSTDQEDTSFAHPNYLGMVSCGN